MDTIEQLEVIFASVTELAAGVRPEQYDDPTPCANFKVRDLFDHLAIGASQLGPQLRGEQPPAPPTLTDDNRAAAVKHALDGFLDAARSPGAADRVVGTPFGEIPGSVLTRFITVDCMTHASDLARATGQRYRPDDSLASEVLATAQQLIAPEMRDGDTFAAETPVPDDASALTKLIGFTGRAI